MNKKPVLTTAFIAVLLCSALVGVQFVRLASANFILPPAPALPRIYIRSDGSVDPPTAPIQRVGNVYTFTGDITDYTVEVQCDNIIIDGAGFIFNQIVNRSFSYAIGEHPGIELTNRNNVIIKNINIISCVTAICIINSSSITITKNNLIGNDNAIMLSSSSFNTIIGNNITSNTGYGRYGFWITDGNYNSIIENNISKNAFQAIMLWGTGNRIVKNNIDSNGGSYGGGIHLYGVDVNIGASNNIVVGNNISNNGWGQALGYGISGSGSSNIFHHNNYINNAKPPGIYPGYTNTWDNGFEGNYWSDYEDKHPNAKELNSSGIWNTPYFIKENNIDHYPLMKPVNTSTVEIPPLAIPETPIAPAENLTPSHPLLAMPEEYINYTICRVNGSLWAKVDGTYPLYKMFGAGDVFELNGVEYVVLSDELPLVYPTPPGTTNISVKMNDIVLNWSNYTETHPEALHHTAIGDWPMIYCKINHVPDYFTLKIHYEHLIPMINGSYTFVYDLNISPYLSPWCPNSTAYFNIRMETNYTNLHVYTTVSWNPVNYTITKENTAEIITLKIVSEYSKPLLGDLLVTFAENSTGSSLPMEYGYAMVAVIVAVATVAGYLFFKRKKSSTVTETSITELKGEIVNE